MINQQEKNVLYLSVTLMVIFGALVLYAGMGLGVELPDCTNIAPFTESKVIAKDNNHFEIHYVAKMWSFEPAELVLPEKSEVDIYLSALDVQHGFNVPGTNLNLQAIPGSVNAARHRFDKKGEYLVICHEYCGLNHQNMSGKIKVVSREEYQKVIVEKMTRTLGAGEKLSADKQCSSCHSADGTEGLGPTFKGLYGSRTKLKDGTEVLVDDAYIIDSILHPDHKIVANYDAGSMPPPDTPLTEQELQQLVDYIKALK